jgi:LPXTG-motif cell wall-anchored protein
MSLTRRLAAGLPAAGLIIFAALAFGGTPASADASVARAAQPVVASSPCAGTAADCKTGYGADAQNPGNTGAGAGPDSATPGHVRGHQGYGNTSPTTTPPTVLATTTPPTVHTVPPNTPYTTTPTGNTDTVPPTGVSPTTVSPSPSGTSYGVSPAHTLPVTGAPSASTVAAGALLVAAGGFALWFARRRRTA